MADVHIQQRSIGAAMLSAALAAGCAGNGNGLDQNGQPISMGGSSSGPITPDLQSIEDHVFTPICSKCHIGASAPEGLQLDAAHAYNALVGVPSAEEPSLLRVNPGNPDKSYMVLKIEGAPGIEGSQMPFGETPLPQATIDAIRQWITNGAPNVAGAAAAAVAQNFAIEATVPMDRATLIGPLARVLVAFTREPDASLVNESTVMLERLGPPEIDPEAAAVAETGAGVSAALSVNEHNPAVLLITPRRPLQAGVYRLRMRGTGGGAVADIQARTLGRDLTVVFTVEPPAAEVSP